MALGRLSAPLPYNYMVSGPAQSGRPLTVNVGPARNTPRERGRSMSRTMKETAMSRREVLAGGAAAFAAMPAVLAGCVGTTSRPLPAVYIQPRPQITVHDDAFGTAP